MQKITGIKSVDFKAVARGHGAVNWNGPTELVIDIEGKSKSINNHSMPKLRGYTNIKGYWDDGNPKYKEPQNINFKETPLYISANCIKHHLFREEFVDLQSPEIVQNMDKLLCSLTGLIRGYVIPKTENKRTSPLLLTDFQDQLGNGNYEQMGRSGSKEKEKTKSGTEKSTSMFSKTTFGDTEYIGYGSISIEQLQFISLSEDYSRCAMRIDKNEDGVKLAEQLTHFIKSIDSIVDAKAVYHKNYVRRGSIFNKGEAGILLNSAAVGVLINETLEILKRLSIRQAKGFMFVEEIMVDYNDGMVGRDMMRIKHSPSNISEAKNGEYAVYFEGI
ncbi:MAG: hypothetical protein HOP02_10980 [Methylococcaceae bacterium]|nr:hypothetical protein [Methylococcaceae bacterium]